MAFTDVEMAILSQCAYYKISNTSENVDLDDYLKSHEQDLINDLGKEYKSSISNLINKVDGKDYSIVLQRNDRHGSGFAAMAISDPDNEVTVACRGTEGISMDYDSRKDFASDLQLAFLNETDQQAQMKDFVRTLEKGDYSGYNFTGHSLGGNLAMYGAMVVDDPSKVKSCVTYNAPGFTNNFLRSNKKKINAINSKMRTYQNECDAVSDCFKSPGKVIILECKGKDKEHRDGFSGHGLKKIIPNSNGGFKQNDTGKKAFTWGGSALGIVTWIADATIIPIDPIFRRTTHRGSSGRSHGGGGHSFGSKGHGGGGGRSFGGGSKNIRLTPAELNRQAVEMKNLENDMNSSFSQITDELNKTNGNWSANLSRNFVGKISTINNSFRQTSQLLGQGAEIAQTSAKTFEQVDSLLARNVFNQ